MYSPSTSPKFTRNTRGLRGASQKTFLTREAAEGWLLMGKYGLDDLTIEAETNRKPERSESPEAVPGVASKAPSDSTPEATADSNLHDKPTPPSKPNSIISISSDSSRVTKASVISISSGSSAEPAEPAAPEPSYATQSQLSDEQRKVLEMVIDEQNVFFTGSAGTGKSLLLREIIALCERCKVPTAVTASTGIAAVNIGGSTLHSWAGIGLGKESKEKLARKILGRHEYLARGLPRKIKKKHRLYYSNREQEEQLHSDSDDEPALPTVVTRWMDVETLIIDEISMIDGKLFDKLEYIARVVRQDDRPFGGIQLIVSGDFCQLPPVPDRDVHGRSVPSTFAFEAESWDRCLGKSVFLTRIFRQKNEKFAKMLNEMRFGRVTGRTARAFRALSEPVDYEDGIEPTELFSTRREVEEANDRKLAQIRESPWEYAADDSPGFNAYGRRVGAQTMSTLLERLLAQQSMTLKVGAQVMLIKNIEQGSLINGSVGKVTGFMTAIEASREHILIGVTKRRRESESATGISDISAGMDPLEKALRDPEPYPVVAFSNGRTMLCVRADFDVTNANGKIEARRNQVPLILAWAMSIHKSQGMTLERVRVDLGSVFEKGQAYVALSRATSMDTLEVRNFDPEKCVFSGKSSSCMD
ncbi:ATP-dependent DNA helicase PIF1 [Phanerochaete sordida]|uniref:ATP-dependent DNA helicase PIF1 n=1 Tax=Phanerochaete sordida TaxID=48140 RepID=A0A9P3G4R7_9APHY|nr:ATP-dependent DNA helicase PIF1 [Phanerochaete sordida]